MKSSKQISDALDIGDGGAKCCARQWMGTNLKLCLRDFTKCEWALFYKSELFFCRHPDAQKFVSSEIKE